MVITCSIAIFGQLGTLLLVSLATERAIAQNTVLLAVVSFSFNTYVIRSVCSYEIWKSRRWDLNLKQDESAYS